ncbi:MAG TPA: histidine kinase, partial [Bacteroidia bacterium]
LLFAFSLAAQEPVFRNYTSKDGLPSPEVYCAMQDSKGYIWFGTDGGVARFDGYTFQNYTTTSGLVDNTVFSIQEDRHGRIWFRSLSGKLCYWKNDSIYAIPCNDSILKYSKNNLMVSFYIDSGDTLWCGFRALESYFKIEPGYGAKQFHVIPVQQKGVNIIYVENEHFICGSSLGPPELSCHLSFFRKSSLLFTLSKKGLSIGHYFCAVLGDNRFAISDDSSVFITNNKEITELHGLEKKFGTYSTGFAFTGNTLWIGLAGKGAIGMKPGEGNLFKNIIHLLNGLSVSNVMTDNEGGTWFTTLENGVYYSSPDHFTLETKLYPGKGTGKIHASRINNNLFVISDTINNITLVSTDTVIAHLDPFSKTASDLFKKENVREPVIFNIGPPFPTGQGKVQSLEWDPRAQKTKYAMTTSHIKMGCYFYLYDSVRQNIYLGDRYYIFERNMNDPVYTLAGTYPVRTFTYAMYDDTLWLGCVNGLWAFVKNSFIQLSDRGPWMNCRINDMKITNNGTWYFATLGNGLIIREKNKYTQLTTANGLPSNNCECLFIDSYGSLWVGTKNGLCKVDNTKNGFSVTRYDVGNELLNQKVSKIFQTRNKLWIMTYYGIMSHDLPVEHNRKNSFPVYLSGFFVNDRAITSDKNYSFAHDQNKVKISWTGISFRDLGRIAYRYRLIGLDTAWRLTQNTSIDYPYLPPGNYKFEVQALLDKQAKTITVPFCIQKPYWETSWFRLVAAVLLLGGAYIIFSYRLTVIRKKEEEKTEINRQLANIEMKALRAQMNPHFIFNAISSIQNYIIKNDSRTAQDYLAKFARLIRNVLENSKSETIPLIQEIETVGLYIELEQLRAPDRFHYRLDVDAAIEAYNTYLPPLLFQPFVENAILHGLLPRNDSKGELTISIRKNDHQLICIIDDNGIGRKKANENRMNRMSHRPLGLAVTEERINMLNRFHSGRASVMIEDKTDAGGEAGGTRITLTIPLYKTEKDL